MKRVDVTKEFSTCVRSIGGTVLDDVLESPDFKNADYWFAEFEVVAEFKCMSYDLAKDARFTKRAIELYRSWVIRGLVPKPKSDRLVFSTTTLPAACSGELLDLLKRKFESNVMSRANRQIKETKQYLNRPLAKGLLIVANDANSLCPPGVFAHLVARLAKRQHSSINSVIFFSANFPAHMDGMRNRVTFWVDGILRDREPVPETLRVALQNAWSAQYSKVAGGPIPVFEWESDMSSLDSIQFNA